MYQQQMKAYGESPSFADAKENIVTENEEKLRYLMLSLPQSLIIRPVVLKVSSPLS